MYNRRLLPGGGCQSVNAASMVRPRAVRSMKACTLDSSIARQEARETINSLGSTMFVCRSDVA